MIKKFYLVPYGCPDGTQKGGLQEEISCGVNEFIASLIKGRFGGFVYMVVQWA